MKIKISNQASIIMLTGRYWEGAYVLRELIGNEIVCKNILIQKSWWKEKNDFEYSKNYIAKLNYDKKINNNNRIYYCLEEIANSNNIKVSCIDNINSEASIKKIQKINPTLIIVVGSRIIKPNTLNVFKDKFLNFHTGILPDFRGSYSEFWALYTNKINKIGTTIHLIDDGIDTGNILSKVHIDIGIERDPALIHISNVRAGAKLIADTIIKYLKKEIKPFLQTETNAHYYTFPNEKQIAEFEKKRGIKVNINFAD